MNFRAYSFISVGAVLSAVYTCHAYAADSIRPYKTEQQKVVYQRYSNHPAKTLSGAKAEDFELLYKGDFAVGASSGNYYCNAEKLPSGLDTQSARILDNFLVTNVGSFASCKRTVDIDLENFQALNHPFFRNGDTILLVTGEVLKGADGKTFKSAFGQGYDAKHYFYVAKDTVTIPYQKQVKLYDECSGWAAVDNKSYYSGEARGDVDAASFKCLTFNASADKKGFLIAGKRSLKFPSDVNMKALKVLQDNFITDGHYVWFAGISPYFFKGIQAKTAQVKGMTISDGQQRWRCENSQTDDQPMCEKQ
ncbi:hypothetical protein VA7868_01697 [Vibrio aerogenes CECT 7868]|uniref:DKNYY family protein n=1 Tax=Vibrio aerogenes CECT 7868 TaxID=1216006 RepID=A0A1M5YH80_9VIBR|nr:hypothetical protein [Vibrio aerogenes]SHI10833.1 hypothetical protein VA7868_01697 [Vibrio aerogenes CECT 7868]